MTIEIKDREHWLNEIGAAISEDIIAEHAEKLNLDMPPVRYSVGFAPRSRGGRVLGVCVKRSASADGHNEIFISPSCNDSQEIAHVLVHELIHAFLDNADGHKGRFAKLARQCGLDGKLTATVPSPRLAAQLDEYIKALGDIPAAKINIDAAGKKQGARMLKVACDSCDFMFRASNTQIQKITHHDCLACDAGQLAVAE